MLLHFKSPNQIESTKRFAKVQFGHYLNYNSSSGDWKVFKMVFLNQIMIEN